MLESQRSQRCLFFCLRALERRSHAARESVSQETELSLFYISHNNRAGGEGLTVREKRSESEESGETEAGTKSTEDSFSCGIMI